MGFEPTLSASESITTRRALRLSVFLYGRGARERSEFYWLKASYFTLKFHPRHLITLVTRHDSSPLVFFKIWYNTNSMTITTIAAILFSLFGSRGWERSNGLTLIKRLLYHWATRLLKWSSGWDLNSRFYDFADRCIGPLCHRYIDWRTLRDSNPDRQFWRL